MVHDFRQRIKSDIALANVFVPVLARAFADFSAAEKDQIAENLGEILGLNGQEVSEAVNAVLDESAQEMIEGLDDFDFDL